MTATLESIGERIWRFLEEALAGRDPDRDIPTSEAILRDLIDILPVDDRGWNMGLQAVTARAVTALAGRPEQWSEAVKLASIYLSGYWCIDHPRMEENVSRGQSIPGQAPIHPVYVKLQDILLESLLSQATPPERIRFFGLIDDRSALPALEARLPTIDLSPDEIVAFLLASIVKGKGILRRTTLLNWARRHTVPAITVVENWLADAGQARLLPRENIEDLVEGIVLDAGDLAWRDHVIARLDARRTEGAWRLAAWIACFAWPEAAQGNIALRHAALLDRVQRFPERLVKDAIWMMTRDRDVQRFPYESFDTASRLYGLLSETTDEQQRRDAAEALTAVASGAIDSARKTGRGDLGRFLGLLDHIRIVQPGVSSPIDSLLEKLVEIDGVEQVRRFVERWLVTHEQAITDGHQSLQEILPRLWDNNPDRALGWVVSWLVAPSRKLRHVAARLFGRVRRLELPRKPIEALSNTQARALVHVLSGEEWLLGTVWVPALIEIGLARPDLIELLQSTLLEDAAEQYPATLHEALARWDIAEPWRSVSKAILDRLQLNGDHRRIKGDLPELVGIRPAAAIWRDRLDRQFQERSRGGDEDSMLLQLLPRVPIARGGASSWTGDPNHRVPFADVKFSFEFPALDLIDPVEAKVRRRRHREEAERLIAEAARESRGSA